MNKPKVPSRPDDAAGRPSPAEPPIKLPPTVVNADRPRDPPRAAPAPPVHHTGPLPGTGSTPTSRMTPYELGAYKYTTAGGHRYSLQMRLTTDQANIIEKIVDAGFGRNLPEESISIAAATAFQESSFNERATTTTSTAAGIFQFLVDPWAERHAHLDRHNTDDQITAMYDDINWFRHRYTEHLATGKIAGTMTFLEYAYAAHTAGPFNPGGFAGSNETQKKVTAFKDKWLILSLHVE
jgi:hypothetical protein